MGSAACGSAASLRLVLWAIQGFLAVYAMHLKGANVWHFDIDRYLNPYLPRNRIHRLPKPIPRFLGYRDGPRQEIGNVLVAARAFLGAFVGIVIIEAVFMVPAIQDHGAPTLIASFGAAAILEYNTIESPLAQPRNTIVGHLLSALIGVSITKLFSLNPEFEKLRFLAGALACGLASAAMTLTKTIHPPAGATALLTAVDPRVKQLGWYLLPLVLLSCALILMTSLLINNIQRQFPTYWWTPVDLGKNRETDVFEKTASSSRISPTLKTQRLEYNEAHVIKISSDGINVPEHICLAQEEKGLLDILHERFREGLPEPSDPAERRWMDFFHPYHGHTNTAF